MAQDLDFYAYSSTLGYTMTSANSNVTSTVSSSTLYSWSSSSTSSYTQGRIEGRFVLGGDGFAYYNICAASAGTVCANTFSNSSFTNDMCPAGWRMPTGAEYYSLTADYGNSFSNMTTAVTSGGAGFSLNGGGFGASNQNSVGYSLYFLLI